VVPLLRSLGRAKLLRAGIAAMARSAAVLVRRGAGALLCACVLAAHASGAAAAAANTVIVQLTAAAGPSFESFLVESAQAALVAFLTEATSAPRGALVATNCVAAGLVTFQVTDTSGKLQTLLSALGQGLTASGAQWGTSISLDMIENAGPTYPRAAACFASPPPAPPVPPSPACGIANGQRNGVVMQVLDVNTRATNVNSLAVAAAARISQCGGTPCACGGGFLPSELNIVICSLVRRSGARVAKQRTTAA
jgi:hypothetical protein